MTNKDKPRNAQRKHKIIQNSQRFVRNFEINHPEENFKQISTGNVKVFKT